MGALGEAALFLTDFISGVTAFSLSEWFLYVDKGYIRDMLIIWCFMKEPWPLSFVS